MLEVITVTTHSRNEMVDITSKVREVVERSEVKEGICVIYTAHTTAAITINENADPAVPQDITSFFNKLVPPNAGYKHAEGNSDSHIKTTLVSPSITVIIHEGKLLLGTWQGIFFCEYDGPRTRKVFVKVVEG
ncbi:MAG: YjbQ family protein [Thermotogaceae bacterium]|nr:YjbQ family protein [Thermotogaceae bacterium]